MAGYQILFTMHAVQRMFHGHIRAADVRGIIESMEIIAEYPAELPHPSLLILGWQQDRPIHVILSADAEKKKYYVITAYQPDASLWSQDFKKRIS